MVVSYLESNEKKRKKVTEEDKELKKQALEAKEKYEKFNRLVETETWRECEEFLKEEIYNALNYSPSDGDSGKWWMMYSWAMKATIERIKSHSKKYKEAVEFLNK